MVPSQLDGTQVLVCQPWYAQHPFGCKMVLLGVKGEQVKQDQRPESRLRAPRWQAAGAKIAADSRQRKGAHRAQVLRGPFQK